MFFSNFLSYFCYLWDFHIFSTASSSFTHLSWEHSKSLQISSHREQALGKSLKVFSFLLILAWNTDGLSRISSSCMRISGEIFSIVMLCMHIYFFTYVLLNTGRVHVTFITNSTYTEKANISLLLLISLAYKKLIQLRHWNCVCMRNKNYYSNNFKTTCLISAISDRRGKIQRQFNIY